MRKDRAVGIDLGTTYSAMAWVDDTGQSIVVNSSEGDLLVPSVVLFDDHSVLVGKEAKKVGIHEAERFAECVKRDMGHPVYSKPIHGRYLPPEVIQAFILKKMKQDLLNLVGEHVRAVITVPAFFDEPRRKATFDAATMAGLEVLDIVNEPTAAALAFGEHLGYLRPDQGPREKMFVLVYDLGGGTFDVTLIQLEAGNIKTLATDGDVRLGGRDWDQLLADQVAAKFMQQYNVDPRQDRVSYQRLLNNCEEAKHTLTLRSNATIRVSHGEQSIEYKVTREQFEEESAHLLERTAYVTRQLLTAAAMEWKDLSRIILVGGSTRMPMVSQMLRERTGMEPDHSVNPDEAVARGAAIYADYLLDQRISGRKKRSFQVTNVNSHSLGIEGVDPKTGRKCNNIIIPRNSALPARKTERFATRSVGQTSVVVKVLEGESPVPSECTPIGRTAIRDLPANLPAGWPILVTYEYGTNGRLNVRAKVKGYNGEADREVNLDLERDGALSSALVQQWCRLVEEGGGLKSFEALTAQLGPPQGANAPAGAQPVRPSGAFPPAAAPNGQPRPSGAYPQPPAAVGQPQVAAAMAPGMPAGVRMPTPMPGPGGPGNSGSFGRPNPGGPPGAVPPAMPFPGAQPPSGMYGNPTPPGMPRPGQPLAMPMPGPPASPPISQGLKLGIVIGASVAVLAVVVLGSIVLAWNL